MGYEKYSLKLGWFLISALGFFKRRETIRRSTLCFLSMLPLKKEEQHGLDFKTFFWVIFCSVSMNLEDPLKWGTKNIL